MMESSLENDIIAFLLRVIDSMEDTGIAAEAERLLGRMKEEKAGVPDTADGYDKPTVPEGVVLNEDIFSAACSKFHELGIPKSQGKALMDWFVGMELDRLGGNKDDAIYQRKVDEMIDLRRRLGLDVDDLMP